MISRAEARLLLTAAVVIALIYAGDGLAWTLFLSHH
jgi:hypothetical protein